jgi:carboxypeptidase family protein
VHQRAGGNFFCRFSVRSIFPPFLLLLIFFLQHTATAQRITGDLQFRVVDSVGHPVTGVNAIVTGPQVQGVRGGVTDELGYFNILALPPGKVSVRVSHAAFQPVVFEDVLIQLGKTTNLGEIRMNTQIHDMPELVISGERQGIDPGTAAYGANLRPSDFENIPVERNYRSIVSLLPQANTSYFGDEVNVAGATGIENKYFVDGVDVTDSFLGSRGTDLPYSFVKDIEVREGGYEAEYPSALGGIVNIITPSGGNEFHGSASGFFTSNQFTASKQVGLLDHTQGGFSDYDAGLGVGGPLVRDELWFYGAYNPRIEQRDVAVPDFGTSVDRNVTHSFAGKLTWRALQRLNLILTATGDPSEWHAVGEGISPSGLANPDPFFSDQKHGGINLSLRGTYASGDGILLNASFSRSTVNGVWHGATERGRDEILFENAETGVWSGGLGFRVDRFIYSNTFDISGTLTAGSHLLKSGFQYKVAAVDEDDEGKRVIRWDDTTFELQKDWRRTTVGDRIPSLYLQDTWRISHGLRLNLGMRWESQFIVASNGTVAQKFTREFQPRVGIVVSPDHEGSQKIFASFGRFYQELSTALSEAYTDQQYGADFLYKHDPRIDPSGADTISFLKPSIQAEVAGLTGQYYDEFNLGYERLFGENLKISVQGIYRTLRDAVEYVYLSSENRVVFGNPGRGELSDYPRAQRDYSSLVFTAQGYVGGQFNYLASYVLSRNYGNYPGLYDSYTHYPTPNNNGTFDFNGDAKISTGLLPNDRTHVIKFSGSYRVGFGLTAGTSFSWQSGTPLSEMAWGGIFLAKRGTSGKTPAFWDLNARFVYDVPLMAEWRPRFILDIFHIASQQVPVDIDQKHYSIFDSNGKPAELNPTYGLALRYQPAMSVRLGMEVSF